MATITVKRKEFEIIAPIGERSYKANRKGKTFFVKDFSNDKEDFEALLRGIKKFKNSAIETPKIIAIDKKANRIAMEYIEGTRMLDMLIDGDLEEKYYEMVFDIDWFSRNDNILLDFRPDQFVFDGKKIVYLPFRYKPYDAKESFAQHYIKYWFYTKELVKYLKDFDLPYNESRIGNEYAKNKEMALMAVKYYK